MDSLFGMNAIYNENYAREYTGHNMLLKSRNSNYSGIKMISDYEYKLVKKCCKDMCQMTLGETPCLPKPVEKQNKGEQSKDELSKGKLREDKLNELLQLSSSEIKEIRAGKQKKPPLKNPEERFRYLQFLYVVIPFIQPSEKEKWLGSDAPAGQGQSRGGRSGRNTRPDRIGGIFWIGHDRYGPIKK